ncbi:MAG: helix-turn-helix domain-containing protein [Christensenellaceae bacterium]|jgi:hypothetical protein
MTFAEKVKHVRSVLQLSQEKFAIMLGVSFATVNRLENGHAVPSYATMEKFASLCKEHNISFD